MNPLPGGDSPQESAVWMPPESLQDVARIGGASAVSELLEDFRTDVAALLSELRQAVASDDSAAVKNCVHSIKGSAAQMGAGKLANACRQLEIEIRRNQAVLSESQLEMVESLFEEVAIAIERHPLARKTKPAAGGVEV
jgi:HPt (histidine-containing phosphotransfer) domain-containing protein